MPFSRPRLVMPSDRDTGLSHQHSDLLPVYLADSRNLGVFEAAFVDGVAECLANRRIVAAGSWMMKEMLMAPKRETTERPHSRCC